MNEAQQREALKSFALEAYKKTENKNLVQKYKFPFETVELPSKGKYNPEIEDGAVKMKYMTAKEEDILSSANLIQQGKAIEMLLDSLIVSTEVSQDNLLIGDRNALVIAARILGYGKDYPVRVTCPKCTTTNADFKIDLNTFEHENVELRDVDEFIFVLPQSQIEVTYRLLRVKDVNEVDRIILENPEDIDRRKSLTTAQQIISINTGEETLTNLEDIQEYVKNHMFINDYRALRRDIILNTPDVNQYVDYTCPKCKEQSDLFIELGPDFFWPGV